MKQRIWVAAVLALTACGGSGDGDAGALDAGSGEGGFADVGITDAARGDATTSDAARGDGGPANSEAAVDAHVPEDGEIAFDDGSVIDLDAGMFDTGPVNPCVGMTDGTQCAAFGSMGDQVCIGGRCVVSRCGDAIVDARTEECDDANEVSGDGCEFDCQWSCDVAGDCDDTNACTADTCTEHACRNLAVADSPATTCNAGAGTCRAGICRANSCGDGIVTGTEECDDGNTVDTDACGNDCVWQCETDAECDDANACTGTETCNVTGHVCVAGTALPACPNDDGNSCTIESCAPTTGLCVRDTSAADADGDGVYNTSCGGGDCNDANPAVSPSAVELCGNGVDDDCNPATPDNTQTIYYADCDGDGVAATGAESVSLCQRPTTAPAACSGGGWTTVAPQTATTIDCLDSNANVFPGQTAYFTTGHLRRIRNLTIISFDYNCDGEASRQYGFSSTPASCGILCTRPPVYVSSTEPACGGSTTTVNSCTGRLTTCRQVTTTNQAVGCR